MQTDSISELLYHNQKFQHLYETNMIALTYWNDKGLDNYRNKIISSIYLSFVLGLIQR